MDYFAFIGDEKFRQLLKRDFQELEICVESKAFKSVLILSGSIIEAVLLEYFTHYPISGKNHNQTLKLALSDLISKAYATDLISERSKDLSTVIRNYRNLIHPGRKVRTKEQFNQ